MNEVFPTEYCPISSTIGFESNHASESAGWPPISWNLPFASSGRSLAAYSCFRDIKIDLSVSPSDVRPKPCIAPTSLAAAAAAHATR